MFYQTKCIVIQGENPFDLIDDANIAMMGKYNAKLYIKKDGDIWYAFISYSEQIQDRGRYNFIEVNI